MLKLQTTVEIPKPEFSIGYNQRILLFGSCFSENIGQNLSRYKFNANVNPFGILYNPASIAKNINHLFNKEAFTEDDLAFHNEKWFSFNHHGSFSSANKDECLQNINDRFGQAKEDIQHTDIALITLGTSWVYRLKKTNAIVANCHKLPSSEFTRQSLSVAEIKALLLKIVQKFSANHTQFIFTVSPIRHWKDGAIENMRSKASLILAIKELQETNSDIYYFPSYEIFMDELRDYRYYASDMLHPSDFAIEYIWDKFKQTFFSKATLDLYKQVDKLVKSFSHRVTSKESQQYIRFKTSLVQKAEALQKENPTIDFSKNIKEM